MLLEYLINMFWIFWCFVYYFYECVFEVKFRFFYLISFNYGFFFEDKIGKEREEREFEFKDGM